MKLESSMNAYVLGHENTELARLELQGEFFREATESILVQAGIAPGMRVLDLGCGVGDVAMSLATLVGGSGEVVGIDRAESALAAARQRATSAGLHQAKFVQGDFMSEDGLDAFDAVVGRFVLLHFAEPEKVVLGVRRLLKAGGVLAFAEMDIASTSAWPPFPELERCVRWILALYAKSGLDPQMGSRLYNAFRRAGLTPSLRVSSRIEAGPQAKGLGYLIETLRTMKPSLLALGIASETDLDLDALTARLSQAMSKEDRCVIFPRLVGAWAKSS